MPCSPRCTSNSGCTGEGDFHGDGGCNHCEGLIIESDDINTSHTCRLRTQVKNGASFEVRTFINSSVVTMSRLR